MSSSKTLPYPAEFPQEEALNLSSDGVLVYAAVRDDAGTITDFTLIGLNNAATTIFGMQPEDVRGKRITELWPGIEGDDIWPEAKQVVETRETYHAEKYRTNPAGDHRWFDVTLRPYKDGFANSYRDITISKEAVLSLEKQKLFYEDLLQQSVSRKAVYQPVQAADGTIENFQYQYANYGKGIDDRHRHLPMFDLVLEGKYLTDVLPSVKRSGLWEFICNVAITGSQGRIEYHYELDGLDAFIDLACKRLSNGNLLIAYSDVTASHKLAKELEAEKSQLDGVFQTVPLGLTVFESVRDNDGELIDLRLIRRNEKALALSRVPPEKYVPGALITELMPKELAHNLQLMYDVVKTGEPAIHELYQPHMNGWIQSRIVKHGDGLLSSIQDITDIKRYACQMQEQAQQLEGILQSSPHAILVFEALHSTSGKVEDFRVIRFNQRAAITIGIPGDKLAQATLFSCMPSMRERLPQFTSVIEHGNSDAYEYHDQELNQWRRITSTPLGEGFVMTMEDVTHQKQITNEIEASAKLMNAVLDASPIALVVYKAIRDGNNAIEDFMPIVVNARALELSGHTAERFLSETFFQRSPPSREARLDALGKVIEQQQPERIEAQVFGTDRWVSSITTPFGDGFISTGQDITAHKEQTRIIEEQAFLFEGIMKSLQNGLTIFAIIRNEAGELEDLEYKQVSDTTIREMHMPREAVIGNTMRKLIPGIEETDYWTAYQALANTGEPQHFETHFTLQGYDNYMLNWITPLGNDKLVSVYYIINDLKRAQRELEHTVHELKRSNDDLEQFASVASHDLQEPLRKLQSFGNLLEQRYSDSLDEQGRNLLQRMQGAAGRMRDLVTGLLSFARLSGYSELAIEPVDLHRLIYSINSDLDEALAVAGGTVTLVGEPVHVLGIEGQLRHLFHNLLSNAIKFRKPDVPPVVSVRVGPLHTTDGRLLTPTAELNNYLRIEISDNGIGFEQQYTERIFGLFERLHSNLEYQGTGIGLSICRRVVERHEGAIHAHSVLGEGATFIVLLKRA